MGRATAALAVKGGHKKRQILGSDRILKTFQLRWTGRGRYCREFHQKLVIAADTIQSSRLVPTIQG
jgi:hypothetical protein